MSSIFSEPRETTDEVDEEAHHLALLAPSRPPDGHPQRPYEWVRESMAEFRDRKHSIADTLRTCVAELEAALRVVGFDRLPDANLLHHFAFEEDDAPVTLLPPLQGVSFRKLGASDTRSTPNVYLRTKPLLLRMQLLLAQTLLDLGELEPALRCLQATERLLHETLHVLPALHLDFDCLKLRWRRLVQVEGHGIVNPHEVPGGEKKGVSPPTLSAHFRPFAATMYSPPLTPETDWAVPEPSEEIIPPDKLIAQLEAFMTEVKEAVRVAVREGGHDFKTIESLLYEALREELRVYDSIVVEELPEGVELSRATVLTNVCAVFAALAKSAEMRDFLLHRPSEVVSVPALPPTCVLPPRVQHDLQQVLARQGHEGALNSLQQITSRSALQYLNALRRENAFLGLTDDDRYVADSLHYALYEGLPEYRDKVCLPEKFWPSVQAEAGLVAEDEVIGFWSFVENQEVNPLLTAGAPASKEQAHWFVMLGPTSDGQNPDPMICHIGRGHLLERCKVRSAYDAFCEDVEYGKPASGFLVHYLRSRLLDLLATLELGREEDEDAVQMLLENVVGDGECEDDTVVGRDEAVQLLSCVAQLLRLSSATRIKHAQLNVFLRTALERFEVLTQFE